MPKKPVVATEEELQQAEARLLELIKKAQAEASEATQVTERKWQAAVQDLQRTTDANASTAAEAVTAARTEAKDYTEECVKQLNTQLLTFFPPIEVRITEVHEDVLKKLDETDTKLQQLIVDELSALAAQFDEEIQALKSELTQNLQDWGREAAEALVEQRRQLDESVERLRVECMEDRARIREEAVQTINQLVDNQSRKDDSQDSIREAEKKEIYVKFGEIENVIMEKEAMASSHAEQVAATAESNRSSLAEQNHNRLIRLDAETAQLREGLREVENVSTRRIEWVIKKASQSIKPPATGWSSERNFQSFYSSKFNGAGAWGLQFELQLYGPPSFDIPGADSGTGNLGIYLWACKGTKMACKLYIGERAVTLEKKFNGCSPVGSGRLCWLKDQINKDDDTLRIGVEFLEAMREVEYPTRMPPPPLALTGRAPEDIDGVMKAIRALEGLEEEEQTKRDENALEGSICFMRHLNNRVVEQVQHQVSGMESRMVRKVQWLVQHASKLRQYFPWGQAICSPCFNAAGVENMQFALYPSGYSTAVTDGFCSLFLYAPAGCTLQCFLSIAKQTREITHSWDTAGAFGRTNFCLFDQIIDMVDDTILVTLEIEDASQEVCTPWTHQEAATRSADSHAGSSDKDLSSITKLTKNPGKTPNGRSNGREGKMDSVMHLPSIWTTKSFAEEGQAKADVPENFHSFDEVLNRRPMQVRAGSPGMKTTLPAASATGGLIRKSESAAALRQTSSLTAMQEDLSPPLPPPSVGGGVSLGAATEHWGGEPPGGASSYGQARKVASRRPRPSSGAGARPGSSGATTRFNATS